MAETVITGTGALVADDFKTVKWVGATKGGKAVTIELSNAVNIGNIEFSFAEKDDVVAQVVFTATYDNTNAAADETDEPWKITVADGVTAGAGEILLGNGKFYVGSTLVALTRGGGSFRVEREFRQINADGDRGPVKERIVMEGSTATLTMNVLTVLTKMADLYSAIG